MRLILASASASRQAMLTAAGVHPEILPASVDEPEIKEALRSAGAAPRDIADQLAETKAVRISGSCTDALVIGSDSVVMLANGAMLDKPTSLTQACEHLQAMSGTVVTLISAVVVAEGGQPVWRHCDVAKLHVRPLSPAFLDHYLDAEWPAISHCVGCFRIETIGIQLFDRIDGNYFTILGMPLIPLLAYLRLRGIMPS